MITEEAAPVVFPALSYQNKGFNAYVMGGYSLNGRYSEVDLGLSYTYKWITVGINDYFYPTTTMPNDKYFNFKPKETGHWLEAMITIAPESIPAYLTFSNFFAGADKNMEGHQAYSSYAELGGYYDFLNNIAQDIKKAVPPHLKWYMLPLAFLIGFGIAMLILMFMKKQLKSVEMQRGAVNYVRPGSMSVTASRDSYLYSTVSRTARPKDSGGSHTSSGGGTHGGGGRSF